MLTFELLAEYVMEQCAAIKMKDVTYTQPGSIKYELFGPEPSEQSVCIQMGKVGERIIKKIIIHNENLELLDCGNHCINSLTKKKKDLDLLWVDHRARCIYYREAKANIELDSEKIIATVDKILEISNYLREKYPGYRIDAGLYHWTIYNRTPLKKGLSQIKKCEENGIKVEHPEELFKLLNFECSEAAYSALWRKAGKFFRE